MPKKFTMSLFNFTSLDTYAKHSFHSNSRVKKKIPDVMFWETRNLNVFNIVCQSPDIVEKRSNPRNQGENAIFQL